MEKWSTGAMEYWSDGNGDFVSNGMLEYWNDGFEERKKPFSAFPTQYSKTPILQYSI